MEKHDLLLLLFWLPVVFFSFLKSNPLNTGSSSPLSTYSPLAPQNSSATYNGTLYGQYGEWVDDTGAGTYIDSDFHHNGRLEARYPLVN